MTRILKSALSGLLLLAALLPARPAGAQVPELVMDSEFRPVARAAIDSLYNFNFEGAQQRLQPWRERHPEHPLWELMDGIRLWWQVLADLDVRAHDEELFDRMGKADYAASRLLGRQAGHVDALIIKAISNGYAARHKANRGEWLSSMNIARKALSAYNYLQEQETGLADLKLAEGLKLYYAAYLPEAYPVVRTVSWFLPEGDKRKGLRLLEEAADSAVFASAEATYFLGNIQHSYEMNYTAAARHFAELYRGYPDNVYYARTYLRALFELDRHDEALTLIDEALARWERRNLSHGEVLREELLSYRGRILLDRGRTDRAEEALRISFELGEQLPEAGRRSYHVISGYYLGRALHEQGRSAAALDVLEHVRRHEAAPEYRDRAGALMRRIES